MRRFTVLIGLVAVAVFALPLAAFAAHCENLSKKEGAGTGITVLVDVSGPVETVTVSGHGGYADVWLDFDGDGTGDFLAESDIQIGKNHAFVDKDGNFAEGVEPWVNPGAINKALSEHATKTNGMGFSS
ncbi:MAG TPA: hypothetical protein VF148_13550 [Acidimicrobiia bacterium]